MSYTAYTALIITFHHLSIVLCLIIAVIICVLIYLALVRHRVHRLRIMSVVLVIALGIGYYSADQVFKRAPLGFEVVQTN